MPFSTAELASYILRLCREQIHAVNAPGLIAITGPGCSGKSLLARQLGWQARGLGFEVTLHHLSDYQVQPEDWAEPELSGPAYYEQAFDLPEFLNAVHRDAASRRDGTAGFVIAEGEFLLKSKFRTLWDFSVWLDADDDLIIQRARTRPFEGVNAAELEAMRSPDSVEDVFRTLCFPAHRHHIEADRPREFASMVATSLADGWDIVARKARTG